MRKQSLAIILSFLMLLTSEVYAFSGWEIGPFERVDSVNPIISPQNSSPFFCPIQNKEVDWEVDHTFNPGAVVKDGKVYLFYRAEDDFGQGIGQHTSRLGLAVSEDGFHFERRSAPVLYPDHDDQIANEWPGGCEDPRIVEREDGTYVMTYTQWNKKNALLGVATSQDLIQWKKHGFSFGSAPIQWSKSGSIICRCEGDRLIATKIMGKYWMYWGEGMLNIAISDDLISWDPIYNHKGAPLVVLEPRRGKFDSKLVEAGPPALLTKKGIVLLYNGKNSFESGDSSIAPGAYAAGQVLFDSHNPTKTIARTEECFFKPEQPYEKKGQYQDGTVFIQGLVHFQGRWFLYYGGADSIVGVAVTNQ